MKRLLSLCIATALTFSTFPVAGAQAAATGGRRQRAVQEDRNHAQAEIHRLLQNYLHSIHDQRKRARQAFIINRNVRMVQRELNISEDTQEILRRENATRTDLLSYYMNQPKVSRRILEERVVTRRERERCLAQTPDPCLCPCGHIPETPQKSTIRIKQDVLERKDIRLQKNRKRGGEDRRTKRTMEEEAPVTRPRTMPRPLSPRHLWKKAEEQENEHHRRLAEIKEKYGSKPVYYVPEI